jgi:sporulation protein YlmC with PRC-barrel domain
MKLNSILTTALITSLFTSVLYAEGNSTAEKIKPGISKKIEAPVATPVVGGAVIGISVATLTTTGYRASKLLGSTVYNESGDNIGSIDDFIIGGENEVSFAIISVGGFLGMGDRLVAVPAKLFTSNKEHQVVLPKASKQDLEALPAFQYAK